MKGRNTMQVNEATMIEALQLLFDRDAPAIGKVESIKAGTGPAPGYVNTFDVQIAVPEQA
jgi:hypothetical protein